MLRNTMKTGRAGALVAGVVVAMMGCSQGAGTTAPTERDKDNAAAMFGAAGAEEHVAALAYHDAWRKLWEDHITWTRMVIIGILDDLPGTEVYTARLLKNYEDMEDALAPYYGEDAAEELGDLIKDHLVIAAQILVAAKAGDNEQVTALVATWRANGDAIAEAMAELNPTAWSAEMGKPMWQEHLDVTLAEATKHLAGDFEGELAAWEQVHAAGLMMADFFSAGVITQFQGSFGGPRPR
jgi:hypothetical protein